MPYASRFTPIILVALVGLTGPAQAAAQSVGVDSIDALIRRNLLPLRSLSAADDDFSDLEPLARAIGSARIVQLGEQSHGAGAAFEARARLIKFLHQRMGFDVVVWESGMFDLRAVNAGLREGLDPTAAAQLGIFGIWAPTNEARPLFEYAQKSWATARPLEMAGFDMQLSGRATDVRLRDDLNRFAATLHDPALTSTALRLIGAAHDRYSRFSALTVAANQKGGELARSGMPQQEIQGAVQKWTSENPQLAPKPADLERFVSAIDSLRSLISSARARLRQTHAAKEIDFQLLALENFRDYGRTIYERNALETPKTGLEGNALRNAQWNRRDTQNARIMLWLAREYYAGRKLIVWAHNGHTMNAYYAANWMTLSHDAQPGGMKPTGVFLADSLGSSVYTIALTSYQGKDGFYTMPTQTDVPPAPAGSLEERIHRTGLPFAFLNLRPLRDRPEGKLLSGLPMRLRGYMVEGMVDWPRVIDAVIYMETMKPATRWSAPK